MDPTYNFLVKKNIEPFSNWRSFYGGDLEFSSTQPQEYQPSELKTQVPKNHGFSSDEAVVCMNCDAIFGFSPRPLDSVTLLPRDWHGFPRWFTTNYSPAVEYFLWKNPRWSVMPIGEIAFNDAWLGSEDFHGHSNRPRDNFADFGVFFGGSGSSAEELSVLLKTLKSGTNLLFLGGSDRLFALLAPAFKRCSVMEPLTSPGNMIFVGNSLLKDSDYFSILEELLRTSPQASRVDPEFDQWLIDSRGAAEIQRVLPWYQLDLLSSWWSIPQKSYIFQD